MQIPSKAPNSTLKITLIILAALLVILLAAATSIYAFNSSKLGYDKIYEGVYIGKEDLSNLTIEEASKKISDSIKIDKTRTITLSCEGVLVELPLSETDIEIDALKSAELAMGEGREGTRKERLERINKIRKEKVYLDAVFNHKNDVVIAKINELANQVDIPERELTIELEGEELVITKGKAGKRIIEKKAKKQIERAMTDASVSVVELEKEEVIPPEPTLDYLKKQVCCEAEDATYKVENNRLTIIDEKIGIQMDSAQVETILAQTPGDILRIPVMVTQPQVTAEKIKQTLFPDLLGTYQTTYNASNIARSHNVALASKMINEVVLAPDEVFSYNGIVGPRTAERGFREAGVYVGNKVEQGLGGGICQVSSTLYNAVVLSDLKVVYRTNHSLPVSYVPLGRDATVSYGSIDFKFSNNTGMPIKIVASAQGGKNTVSIYGTKQNPNRKIEIVTECTGVYAPKVEKIEDPLLPIGTVEVEEEGANGSSHITYKITKENGKTIKTESLGKSNYSATDRVERVGTKEEVPTQTQIPEGAEVPPVSETETPVPEETPSENSPIPEEEQALTNGGQ